MPIGRFEFLRKYKRFTNEDINPRAFTVRIEQLKDNHALFIPPLLTQRFICKLCRVDFGGALSFDLAWRFARRRSVSVSASSSHSSFSQKVSCLSNNRSSSLLPSGDPHFQSALIGSSVFTDFSVTPLVNAILSPSASLRTGFAKNLKIVL